MDVIFCIFIYFVCVKIIFTFDNSNNSDKVLLYHNER